MHAMTLKKESSVFLPEEPEVKGGTLGAEHLTPHQIVALLDKYIIGQKEDQKI